MTKNIKDYLHLYLMCSYQWLDGDMEWRRPEVLTAYQLSSIRQSGREVRLLLRPLSDMTRKEELTHMDNSKWGPYTAIEFKWLLSEGFDLFGLIEAGLAIDKTKEVSHD